MTAQILQFPNTPGPRRVSRRFLEVVEIFEQATDKRGKHMSRAEAERLAMQAFEILAENEDQTPGGSS